MGAPEPYIFTLNLETEAPELYISTLKLEGGAPAELYNVTLNLEMGLLKTWTIYFYAKFE